MKICKLHINDLTPYEKNAKIHTPEQIEQIIASIKQFGMNDPIGVWGDKNIIVEGHGRLMALKEMGHKEVDCIRLDHLSDDERKAYTLAHNKLTLNTDFDFDTLQSELDAIELDMTAFGFEELEAEILADEIVEDEVPEQVEMRCKVGDIWQLGNHRLMCGDSTSVDDVGRLMDGEKADMVFTDPPYGMNLDTDYSSMKSEIFKGGIGGKKYEQGMVDDFKPEMLSTIFACFDYVKEIFLWGADYFAELLPHKNNGSWIVWDKRANGNDNIEQDLSSDKMYGSCFELCWSKNKHKRDIARIKWAGIFGMYGEDKKRFHPTQKPQDLVKWFLDRYSKENHSVVDLFGGSGSTLIACEQLNRQCYMMELDEHYCDVIIQRWEDFTGKRAVKL